MNLFESIKIFIEIVESGSFTQAAENLQLHRPAVTKAVQQLEQQSGVRLLQRTTRRINLTPEGEEFYRRSKPLLAQADDLLESFSPERALHGQLRVDMPIAFAALLVVPNLPDFYRQHPDIEIILSSSDRRQDMLRDGLDCVLRVGALEDGDYIARPMGKIKMTTCASPDYLAACGRPETLEDLQQHVAVNWINSSSRQIMPWTFQTAAGTEELLLPGKLVLDNSEAYIAAGLAGLGLLQGMNVFLQPFLDSGRLTEVLPDYPAPPRKLSLLYPHRHLSRKVRVFAEWLERLLNDATNFNLTPNGQ
ncbi:LysR family transcriptional regulator [Buttiauxella sp.]|uniref:LysR family transcriptional regulator n=1 Tax=Buttiauxella sp. TaxID=1972222 RepID=UPI003C7246CA